MEFKELGYLEPYDIRKMWDSESREFTPWLAQHENLSRLGRAVNMDLQLEGKEVSVGKFRADLLCRDLILDKTVLIENQLEITDHCHLGQILTYAAGLKASSIIWIAKQFTEEHRAALTWLNDNTEDNLHFFGVELEGWVIPPSLPAPHFNVVVQPNEWSNMIAQETKKIRSENLSELKELQLAYWTSFLKTLKDVDTSLNVKPQPRHFLSFTTGFPNADVCVRMHCPHSYMGVEIFLSGAKAKSIFYTLHQDKESIENEIGEELDWQPLPEKIGSRILLAKQGVKFDEESEWRLQHEWLKEKTILFKRVFLPRLKSSEEVNLQEEELNAINILSR